jgi:Transcriptional regulator
MTITQIHYFVEVARQMNFTKAANHLFVVQQVVSRQVKALEEELGFPLFHRGSGQLRLTDGGQILYRFWENMLKIQEDTLMLARRAMDDEINMFRVGTLAISWLQDLLAQAISAVSRENKNIRFQIECDSYRELRRKLGDKLLDCIISLEDENYGMSEEYETQILRSLRPHLIIAVHHPLYRHDMEVNDLKDTTLYILSPKFSLNAKKNILEYCQLSGFEPKHIQYFDDVSGIEMALSAGNGAALIFPEFFRNPFDDLAIIELKNTDVVKTIGLSVTYQKKNKKRLQPFLDQLFAGLNQK